MQEALGNADGLASVWAQLTGMLGALEGAQAADAGGQGGYRVAVAECTFENADATLTLAFDSQGRLGSLGLAGMRMRETPETAGEGGLYRGNGYAARRARGCHKRAFDIARGRWPLPGGGDGAWLRPLGYG